MKPLSALVVTPSLNKSFKFQSDWPYNNSQVYLLNSIIEDLQEDEDREFKTTNDGYYFSSSVNYPNNKSLVSQHVYVDKNGIITKVEVVDKNDNVQIQMKFTNIEFNKKFDKDYFELSNLLNTSTKKETRKNTEGSKNDNNAENSTDDTDTKTENGNTNSNVTNNNTSTNHNANSNTSTNNGSSSTNNNSNNSNDSNEGNPNNNANNTTTKTEQTATINDVIYPMYLPGNTYLTNQEKVDTKTGQRLILTFGGDHSFVLVEETASYEEEGLIIPVSGEFDFLSDVIGVIGAKSLTWQSNGIEYYLASDAIETAELVEIARSISVLPVSK